jgi:YMGG-like Gly-zipper
MKKLFLVCAAATFFIGCNSDSKSGIETTKEIVPDSSAQYKNSVNTDTPKTMAVPLAAPLAAKPEVKEITNANETKTRVRTRSPHTAAPVKTTQPPVSTTTSPTKDTVTSTTPASTTDNTTTSTSTTPTPATPAKRGMSSSAKGAIIGGGAGAVGGAILSKKKGKGAIIGGLLGAGAGYIIGRKKDKNKADTTK